MAFATFFLNWLGSLARLFTVMVEAADDNAFVASFLIAVCLTSTIMLQFACYYKKDQMRRNMQRIRKFDSEE